MKIKVGRLKELIQEELDTFKKMHEYGGGRPVYKKDDEYDIDTEDVEEVEPSEALGKCAGVIMSDLEEMLEEWEETEYESDESRWQAYAEDVQDLIDEHEEGEEEEPEEHTEEECEEVHPGQAHEEWEGGMPELPDEIDLGGIRLEEEINNALNEKTLKLSLKQKEKIDVEPDNPPKGDDPGPEDGDGDIDKKDMERLRTAKKSKKSKPKTKKQSTKKSKKSGGSKSSKNFPY